MNVTLLSGACIKIFINYSSISANIYVCLLAYLSVLYPIIVITCVCQCDSNSIKKLVFDSEFYFSFISCCASCVTRLCSLKQCVVGICINLAACCRVPTTRTTIRTTPTVLGRLLLPPDVPSTRSLLLCLYEDLREAATAITWRWAI